MRIKRFENSVFSSNSYAIDDGNAAVIFDIGDTSPIFKYLQTSGLSPIALFITVTHYDHIYGILDFMSRFPDIPIYTSEFGKEAFRKPNWNFSRCHDDEISIDSDSIKILMDGETLSLVDDIELEVFATPGHDKSCLSYRIGESLLTGDSYIPGVRVVTSFPNSNKGDTIHHYARLEAMASTYTILPGHGEIVASKQ